MTKIKYQINDKSNEKAKTFLKQMAYLAHNVTNSTLPLKDKAYSCSNCRMP